MYEMEGALLDLPSRLATAPSSTGSGGPTAGASHPRPVPGFPVPFGVPRGFPLGWCPFPTWMYFYSPGPGRRKGPREATEDFFRCPQDEGGYPRLSWVIHRLVHSISTGHRLACRAGYQGRTCSTSDRTGSEDVARVAP